METKELLDSLNTKMGEGFKNLQEKSDQAIAGLEKGETVSTELKGAIENLKGELERTVEQVQELEQKGVKIHGQSEQKNFLDLVKSNEDYTRLSDSKSGSAIFELEKAGIDELLERKFSASGSNLEVPTFGQGIQLNPRQELKLRDLIPTIPVSTAEYTYFKEDAVTLGAATVAEGAAKPQNSATFTTVTDRVKKIAVWTPITMEAVQDIPQIQAYIRDLHRYDIKLAEEAQILKGDGTGENLNGIFTQATAYDSAGLAGGSDTAIDTIRRAIYQVRKQSLRSADAIALTELDWMNIELLKDADNKYLFANLQGLASSLLWGRPVVTTDSLDDAANEFMVGAFNQGARIYDRMAYTVKVGMINDDFIKNQSVVLAEERLGLGVNRKACFVKGTL